MKTQMSVKKNFAWQTMAQLLKIILPIITSPYLAKILGGEGTGIYSYTSSIASYFAMFMMLGIENYGSRLIAKVRDDKDKLNKVFSELLVLHMIISVLVAAVYFLYALFVAQYQTLAIIQGLVIVSMFFSISWFFNGLEEIRATAIRFLVIKTVSFALLFVIVKGENALVKYTALMAASSLISEVILWFKLKSKVRFVRPDWMGIKEHIPFMLILFIPAALESVYNLMDKIMLGSLTDISQVGYYEYASKALIVRTVITSLGVVLLPRIANLYEKKDYKKMWKYIDDSLKVSMVLAIALSFGIAAIASDFSQLFWGGEFIKCGKIMEVLAFTTIFWTVAQVIRTQYLIPTSKDKEYIFSIFAGAVVNIVLNLVLIPVFAGVGAAIATLITEIIVCGYQLFIVRKQINKITPLHHYLIYIFIGCFMMAGVLLIKYIMPTTWLAVAVEVLCGFIIYLGLCMVYWKITKESFYLPMINKVKVLIIERIKK